MSGSLSKFNWASLLLGIVALFAALVSFRDPAANLAALTVLFGIAAVVRGVLLIYAKFSLDDVPGVNTEMFLLLSIVNVVFGVLLLGNLWSGMMLLPTLFAIWFIIDSILGLANSGVARAVGKGYYWFRLILGVVGILLGVSLLFHPMTAAITLSFLVGIYFLILAINCFVEAFHGGR